MTYSRHDGFTLVELSIVLVIIGLLIGGILAAQSMIGTAKIQAQVRQLQQFDITATAFHTKFGQLPGDCSICNHNGQRGGETGREGNNDGILEDFNGNTPPQAFGNEPSFFFPDMTYMGIWNQNYVQTPNPPSGRTAEGWNYPRAALGRGGVIVSGNNYGDIFYILTSSMTSPTNALYAYFNPRTAAASTPAEALALDTKIDDGIGNTGDVYAAQGSIPATPSAIPFGIDNPAFSCLNSGSATYNVSNNNPICWSVIKAHLQ